MSTPRRMRVLLAYDGSAGAEAALAHLCQRRAGLPAQGHMRVVDVADLRATMPWLMDRKPAPTPVDALRLARLASLQAERYAARTVREAAQRLQQALPGWRVEMVAATGSAAEQILAHAGVWRADLIVLGWRGQHLAARWLLGSVALQVLNEAPCSVRVVRGLLGPAETPVRLVLGMDGSPSAEAAVAAMGRRRWPKGTAIRVVSIIPWERLPVPASPETFTAFSLELQQRHLAWMTRKNQQAARVLARLGLSARAVIMRGDPKRVLLAEAARWQADCVVVGASGTRGVARLFMGSVATAVTLRAPCTVEVVRPAHLPHASKRPRRRVRAAAPAQ